MRIPDWSIAAGNPCRVLRKITEDDRRKEFHNKQIDEEVVEDYITDKDEVIENNTD